MNPIGSCRLVSTRERVINSASKHNNNFLEWLEAKLELLLIFLHFVEWFFLHIILGLLTKNCLIKKHGLFMSIAIVIGGVWCFYYHLLFFFLLFLFQMNKSANIFGFIFLQIYNFLVFLAFLWIFNSKF